MANLNNSKKVINTTLKIILVIILVIVIYQTFKAVIGGTWQTENIIISAIGVILTILFTLAGFLINQNRVIGMIDERTKIIGENLKNLGKDFKEHAKQKHK